jgi:hypothetical protein
LMQVHVEIIVEQAISLTTVSIIHLSWQADAVL